MYPFVHGARRATTVICFIALHFTAALAAPRPLNVLPSPTDTTPSGCIFPVFGGLHAIASRIYRALHSTLPQPPAIQPDTPPAATAHLHIHPFLLTCPKLRTKLLTQLELIDEACHCDAPCIECAPEEERPMLQAILHEKRCTVLLAHKILTPLAAHLERLSYPSSKNCTFYCLKLPPDIAQHLWQEHLEDEKAMDNLQAREPQSTVIPEISEPSTPLYTRRFSAHAPLAPVNVDVEPDSKDRADLFEAERSKRSRLDLPVEYHALYRALNRYCCGLIGKTKRIVVDKDKPPVLRHIEYPHFAGSNDCLLMLVRQLGTIHFGHHVTRE